MHDGPGVNVLETTAIEQFARDGFLLVEDFFADEELDRFGTLVDRAVADRTSDDKRKMHEKNLYEQTFVQCMRLWEDHPHLAPLTFHPKLCAAAADLLGVQRIRLWHDQALYKEAGGRKTDAHMDYPFWPCDKPNLVSAWFPFHDVARGGGIMGYVQGSHTMGSDKFVDIGQLRGGEPYDLLQEPDVASRPFVWVEAPKGSVIFHHACTIHAAEANDTDTTRRVFTTVYMEDGRRRKHDSRYFSLDRDKIETGEEINGPGFPLAWPRKRGDLPRPPAERGPRTGFGFVDDTDS